jgi:hypothetical protein
MKHLRSLDVTNVISAPTKRLQACISAESGHIEEAIKALDVGLFGGGAGRGEQWQITQQ